MRFYVLTTQLVCALASCLWEINVPRYSHRRPPPPPSPLPHPISAHKTWNGRSSRNTKIGVTRFSFVMSNGWFLINCRCFETLKVWCIASINICVWSAKYRIIACRQQHQTTTTSKKNQTNKMTKSDDDRIQLIMSQSKRYCSHFSFRKYTYKTQFLFELFGGIFTNVFAFGDWVGGKEGDGIAEGGGGGLGGGGGGRRGGGRGGGSVGRSKGEEKGFRFWHSLQPPMDAPKISTCIA